MEEEKLIFLISQPRSGSSMFQQLILNSPEIDSAPEPWLMLSLINTYKKTKLEGEYNPFYSQINFVRFLNSIEGGLCKHKSQIKQLALNLYGLSTNKKDAYFLDKTPRYYHIVEELYEIFPNAKFIFLVRNPLAVFSSILSYNFKGSLKQMFKEDRLYDIYEAPKIIAKIKNRNTQNAIFIRYEDIINNTPEIINTVFNYLQLEVPKNSAEYKINNQFKVSNAIDLKGVKKHNKPVHKYLNSWKETINTNQKKKIAIQYLLKLDQNYFDTFGYNKQEILNELFSLKTQKTYFNLPIEYFEKYPNALRYKFLSKLNSIFNVQRS